MKVRTILDFVVEYDTNVTSIESIKEELIKCALNSSSKFDIGLEEVETYEVEEV